MNNSIQLTDAVSIRLSKNNILYVSYLQESLVIYVRESNILKVLLENDAKEIGCDIVTGVIGITKGTKQLKFLRTVLEDLRQNDQESFFITCNK